MQNDMFSARGEMFSPATGIKPYKVSDLPPIILNKDLSYKKSNISSDMTLIRQSKQQKEDKKR